MHQTLEIWNFVCRFGETEVLLDRYTDLVEPALFGKHQRRWGDTSFFLYDVNYFNAGTKEIPTPAVAGRLVKDTVLRQEQKLQDGRLVPADGKLPSAPSSLFVLLLATHRLLFIREQQGSPEARQFASSIDRFIRAERLKIIEKQHKESRSSGQLKAKADLHREIPLPDVTVTPVLSHSEVEAFIDRFSRIRRLSVAIEPTNDEPDNEAFFRYLRANGAAINAKSSRVEYVAKANESLDSDSAAQSVRAARNGLASFRIEGLDNDGNRLTGDNEKLRIMVPFKSEERDVVAKATEAVASFRDLRASNDVDLGDPIERSHATLLGLVAKLPGLP
jgi:hypothetical protein